MSLFKDRALQVVEENINRVEIGELALPFKLRDFSPLTQAFISEGFKQLQSNLSQATLKRIDRVYTNGFLGRDELISAIQSEESKLTLDFLSSEFLRRFTLTDFDKMYRLQLESKEEGEIPGLSFPTFLQQYRLDQMYFDALDRTLFNLQIHIGLGQNVTFEYMNDKVIKGLENAVRVVNELVSGRLEGDGGTGITLEETQRLTSMISKMEAALTQIKSEVQERSENTSTVLSELSISKDDSKTLGDLEGYLQSQRDALESWGLSLTLDDVSDLPKVA